MRTILQKGFTFVWILLGLSLCSGTRAHAQDLTKLATDLAARIHAKGHERVTVVDFLDLEKKPNKLAKFLTHQLQSALTEPERDLMVVDQSRIADLFDQMEKLSEGLIDPATARELGKISGAEVLIYGTVMVSSLSVRLDVSAIDLQTAKVIASGTASPKRFGLLDRLAKEVEQDEGGIASDQEESEASAPVKKASAKKPARTLRDQGFIFKLGGCSTSGDAMTCAVTVTSEGRDRWLIVSEESRAWNEAGDEFSANELMISNTQSERSCMKKQILRDVPTNVAITFSEFGSDGSTVERFRLAWSEKDSCYGLRTADFEKISLSDSDSRSSRGAGSGAAAAGNSPGSKRGGGGILGRLTEKVLETAASTVEKVIDKKAKEVTGEDEDEDEDQPQE
ncbi:MAG TPA: hypothetical protein VNW71_16165 [Thermoanaerobaculia bacterium]|nr:hypothetical protein [Thermoanaerobaculia bacterium]